MADIEGILFVAALVATPFILHWLHTRRTKKKSAGRGELYAIAARADHYYQSSAHPADLLEHTEFQRGVDLLCDEGFAADDLDPYIKGDNPLIACMALAAAARRRDVGACVPGVLAALNALLFPWPRYFALQVLRAGIPPGDSLVGPLLLRLDSTWGMHPSYQYLEELVHRRVQEGEVPTFGTGLEGIPNEQSEWLRHLLGQLGDESAAGLRAELEQWLATRTDTHLLGSIGRIWDERDAARPVFEHPQLTETVVSLEVTLNAERARSVLLVGEPGVGKTATVRALAARLRRQGWHIFEAGHAELLAGQIFIGQLEERLRTLVQELTGQRRILWYVPDFHLLTWTGRSQQSPIGALEFMLPHIDAREITVLGETHPAAYERLLLSHPRCLTALDVVRVEPLPAEQTRELAARWGGDDVSADTLSEAWLLAQQYLGDKAAPGNLLELLGITRQRLARRSDDAPSRITLDDLIVTLTQLTGLPASLLDERQGLHLDGLRALFERRVLGQPEAVDCLVERVAMIKAGVNDPTRPLGVFLFAGPTGTGKTEIGKALTEFLFGSANRMIRLDMSEFQTPESVGRIIGEPQDNEQGALVDQIRRQPFSVVLLDEFEKAHPNIWDLFLQVFDDGRLTDRRGTTVDCRHALFIMTSNLGGVIPTTARLGFAPDSATFDPGAVADAIRGAFRREFLNRIDRVVIFRPLGRDSMRKILHQEIDAVFERRGLRNRTWAVVWDDAALEFLLEKGFTSDLGARPLKRAVESHLLTPLAMTIVDHQFPEGDQFLFVKRGESRLEVEFIDPDAPDEEEAEAAARVGGSIMAGPASPASPATRSAAGGLLDAEPQVAALQSILLDPHGESSEIEQLAEHYEGVRRWVEADAWQEGKQLLFELMAQPDFWSSPERFAVLGEVEFYDRIEAGFETARSLQQRLTGQRERGRRAGPRQLLGRLALQLFVLEAACLTIRDQRPRDAFVLIEAPPDAPGRRRLNNAFAARIDRMYRQWAQRRRMQLRVLREPASDGEECYMALLAVTGFGAFLLLEPEHGLHVLEIPADDRSFQRAKVQVQIAAQPDEPAGSDSEAWLRQAEQVMSSAAPTATVVRRYREEPSPLVRDGVRGWRSGRIERVLDGDFDLFGPLPSL